MRSELHRERRAGARERQRGGRPACGDEWFDTGTPLGLAIAPNGDIVQRLQGHTPLELTDYDAIARFDAAGHFLWSQSARRRAQRRRARLRDRRRTDPGRLRRARACPTASPRRAVARLLRRRDQQQRAAARPAAAVAAARRSFAPGRSGHRQRQRLRFYGTGVALLLQVIPRRARCRCRTVSCLTGVVTRLQGANATSFTIDSASARARSRAGPRAPTRSTTAAARAPATNGNDQRRRRRLVHGSRSRDGAPDRSRPPRHATGRGGTCSSQRSRRARADRGTRGSSASRRRRADRRAAELAQARVARARTERRIVHGRLLQRRTRSARPPKTTAGTSISLEQDAGRARSS